jgi:predicted transposase YbfD/YdcC
MNTITTREKTIPSLAEIFTQMIDHRKPKGVRYPLPPLLILLSVAKLCAQDTPSAITEWVQHRGALLQEKLGVQWKRMPSLSTWQRLIGANLDATALDEKVGDYFQDLSVGERQSLNLDGKVVCGTRAKETGKQLHLLALQESATNAVVAQTELLDGENEISAAHRLLEAAPLEAKIVTGDAIFAQQELARKVVEKGGDYLWKLRANQGTMYAAAHAYFAAGTDKYGEQATSLEKGHGRIDEREIVTSFRLAAQCEFPYLTQVFRIRRKSEEVKTGKQSEQTIYGITSLPVEEFGAAALLAGTRKHWSIENGLHYRRDVTFHEDAGRQTRKAGGRVLATFNNLTIGVLRQLGWENIAKARRYFEARIEEALNLLLLPLQPLL